MTCSLIEQPWIPRADRHAVSLNGLAKLKDGREVPLRVRNLSNSGCMFKTEHTLPIGEVITLILPHGEPLHAHIRWSFLGKSGASFLVTNWVY